MTETETLKKYTEQSVISVRHWGSPGLISVTVTRDPAFQFLPGQFARIGLPSEASAPEPDLWRAYSMVSHPDDDYLEFLSVTVPDGQFSPKLAQLSEGQALWVDKTPFGFLTLERFEPAQVLWLVATGTGISAYLPMLRDQATWQQFKEVVLVHGTRTSHELAYRDQLETLAQTQPHFLYLPVTSRESWNNDKHTGTRITTAYIDGLLESVTGQPLNPEDARIMLCGNPAMVTEMRALLSEKGFAAGRRGIPGTLAVENYW
jgi:ferredoxin--NADP+ reductase